MVRECRPPDRLPGSSWFERFSTMATSTPASARSTYVARARVTLGALAGFVVLCGFALLPRQTSTAFGFESFVLLVVLIADVLRHIRAFEAADEGLKGALLVRTAFALALFGIG